MLSHPQKDINNGPWRATNKFINVVNKSNVYKLIKPTIIEAGLKYGLATGNWGVKTSRVRQGVAQVGFSVLLCHVWIPYWAPLGSPGEGSRGVAPAFGQAFAFRGAPRDCGPQRGRNPGTPH